MHKVRTVLAKVYAIPVVGYGARLIVTLLRLPRLRHSHQVLEKRHQVLEERHQVLETGWRQHVPAFLNAVSSVGALAHQLSAVTPQLSDVTGKVGELSQTAERHWSKIGDVEQRLEFIRRELMFEMRYGGSSEKTPVAVEPRILNPEVLAKAGLKLNLGCGHVPLEGYVNVDARQLPNVDVVASLDALPFEPAAVSEILLAHVVEHFPQEEFRLKLLPYWARLLEPGGGLRIIVPDAEAMIAACAAGTYTFEDFREVFFGGQEYAGDFHYNMFTPDSLTTLLRAEGFTNIDVVASARRNGRCFEFEVVARAPRSRVQVTGI